VKRFAVEVGGEVVGPFTLSEWAARTPGLDPIGRALLSDQPWTLTVYEDSTIVREVRSDTLEGQRVVAMLLDLMEALSPDDETGRFVASVRSDIDTLPLIDPGRSEP
jgi:hypothetical protein